MAYCCKCGKEIEEGMTYCSECEKPVIDVVENTESQKTDKKTKKKGKIAKLISDNKDNVVKGGAAAAVQFVVKKGCLHF